jgi:hypothetical protein
MTAIQCCGMNGGWPLSMFLTPDGKPIFGGTYWPPDDREVQGGTLPGFKSVLTTIIRLEKEKPQKLREQADAIADLTQRMLKSTPSASVDVKLSRGLIDAAVESLESTFDPLYGGFGNPAPKAENRKPFQGPKFPTAPSLELLWFRGARQPALREHVLKTLTEMARGGIYDQLGGGFHRYSTERTWTVPHFEKMLYDNAQLVELYSTAFATTHDPLFRRVVAETLEFVRRDLTHSDGGFYSALDADSESEEGKSYVWTASELSSALQAEKDRALALRIFGCDGAPNFEGRAFVLTRRAAGHVSADDVERVRSQLLEARRRRPQPFLDTKIITGWNGQMIAACAQAGVALGEPKYTAMAIRAADFALRQLRLSDGRLARTYAAATGEPAAAHGAAYLDDYAFLIHGLLSLHDATKSDRWLMEARALTERMIQDFGDIETGGFYFTPKHHETIFVRTKDQFDGAQPSGNSVAVRNLLRLSQKTGDGRYRTLAGQSLRSFAPSLEKSPSGLSTMAMGLDTFLAEEGLEPAPQAPGVDGKKSDSVVKVSAKAEKPSADGKQMIKLTMTIDKGWHVYANPIGNEDLESAQTKITIAGIEKSKTRIEYPKGKLVRDKLVGDYNVYDNEAVITVHVDWPKDAAPTPLEISIKLQACNDKSCLLPATIKLKAP